MSKLTDKQADLALRLLAIGTSNLGGHYDVGEGTEINYDMEWRSMVGGLLAETGNDDFWRLNGQDEIERLLRQGELSNRVQAVDMNVKNCMERERLPVSLLLRLGMTVKL